MKSITTIKKTSLSFSLTVLFFFVFSFLNTPFASYLSAAGVTLAILVYANERSAFHMMTCVGHMVFIATPAFLHNYYNDIDFALFHVTSFLVMLLLINTYSTEFDDLACRGKNSRKQYYLGLIIAITLLFINAQLFVIFIPLLIILMIRSFEKNKVINNFFLLIVFFACYSLYLIFFWNGFGRTVVSGVLLCAILYFIYASKIYFNKYLLFASVAFAPLVMTGRKSLNFENIDLSAALNDSAFGPYGTAANFISEFNEYDLSGLFGQWLYSLFIFIPRSIWSSKPNGFGFEYTIQNLDWSYIDSGHSIAATFAGEHLYFMGYLGLISAILMVLLIARAVSYINDLKYLHGSGTAIFSANIMALTWGGMSSFSTRFSFSFIIFLAFYYTYKKTLDKWKYTSGKR